MYVVRWDNFDGQRHELQYKSFLDAKMETEALAMLDTVEWVEYGPV